MIAREFIHQDITPIDVSQSIGEAIERMEREGLVHYPVVDKNEFAGILSETTAFDLDETQTIASVIHRLSQVHVSEDEHLLDCVKHFGEERLSLLPVVAEKKYEGYVTPTDVLHAIGGLFSLQVPGSVVILEVEEFNYSMAQLAQIVEGNDAKILAAYIHRNEARKAFEVTLKIDFSDLSSILASFRRYDYTVVEAWHENRYEQDLKQRFDQFMNYLNM